MITWIPEILWDSTVYAILQSKLKYKQNIKNTADFRKYLNSFTIA
jgi:hypothetical protein